MSEYVADLILTALLVVLFWLWAFLVRRETHFGRIMALVCWVLGGVFAWAIATKFFPDLTVLRVPVKLILALSGTLGILTTMRERWMVTTSRMNGNH
jgi:membrane associated rhomboid family serine protease